MSLIDTAGFSEPSALNPNRNDAVGLSLSVLLPLAAVVVMQAFGATAGVPPAMLHYAILPVALPEPIATMLPFMLFPLWGMARWAAWQSGRAGQAASWWVVALMGAMIVYPYVALGLDGFLLNWLDLFMLLLAGAAAMHVGPVSRPALACMLPSLLVLTLAAIPGYVALTGGWSPGLAITVALVHPER